MKKLHSFTGLTLLMSAGIVYSSDQLGSNVPSKFVNTVLAGKHAELKRLVHSDLYFYVYDRDGSASENLPLANIFDEVSNNCAIADYTDGGPRRDGRGDEYYLFYMNCPKSNANMSAIKIYMRDNLISHLIFHRKYGLEAPPPSLRLGDGNG